MFQNSRRRTVVVTKKRLIQRPTQTQLFNEMTQIQEHSSGNPDEYVNSKVVKYESVSEKEFTDDDSTEFNTYTPVFEGRDLDSGEQINLDNSSEEDEDYNEEESEEEITEEPLSEEALEPPKFATIFDTDFFILPTTEQISGSEEFTSTEDLVVPSESIASSKVPIIEYTSTEPTELVISSLTSTVKKVTQSIITTSSSTSSQTKNIPHSQLASSTPTPVLPSTHVLISTKYDTKTFETTRLRTYTFIITTAHDNEQIVTSTTEVRPQIKTTTVTDTLLVTRTVTLTNPLTSNVPGSSFHNENTIAEGRRLNQDEARYNLATRIMSNGVEVIVAGDKSTYPGDPMMRRIASTGNRPITLAPSTLSDHMQMLLPHDSSEIANKFVTRTCLTTYTYLTTYLENGSTTVKSHEQVISNTATEERKPLGIVATPTASSAITLTQNPNLATGVFHTTYTYFNTIMDDEQPLVITSKHTVANTVTAPDDYLSILQPSESVTPILDTNTYLSTVSLTKTLVEGIEKKVISTTDVVTQVIVTESIPPQGTSVMTSYTAYDIEDVVATPTRDYSTTDVVKTYFVTYTYYNTFLENDKTVVRTNVSTSSDIVTEKLYLHPKRTQTVTKSPIKTSPIEEKATSTVPVDIFVTKTYLTTYTYFTTYLQEGQNKKKSTVSSNTRTVENVATESLTNAILDPTLLRNLGDSLGTSSLKSIVTTATLHGGEEVKITAVHKGQIKPTKTMKIESTTPINTIVQSTVIQPSSPSVITGSTIVFVDDDPFANFLAPSPTSKPTKAIKPTKQNVVSVLLSSEIVDQQVEAAEIIPVIVKPGKPIFSSNHIGEKHKNATIENKKRPLKIAKPTNGSAQISELLNLGSLGIKTLGPVINAMAGLIQTNLNGNRRSDNITTTTFVTPKPLPATKPPPAMDLQNRSPIYIPVAEVQGEEGIETAESQDVASFEYNLPANADKWLNDEPQYKNVVIGKPTHESPLVNGGIPISPGQVITANSDVIVGKPSVHGPRIPNFEKHLPNNYEKHQPNNFEQHVPNNFEKHPHNNVLHDDVPLGMKPPPLPKPQWPKRNHDVHRPNDHNSEGSSKVHRLNEYKGPVSSHVIPVQQYNSYGEAIGPLPDQFEQHKHLITEILEKDLNDRFNTKQQNNHGLNIDVNAPFNLQSTINNIPFQLPNMETPISNPQLLHVPENNVQFNSNNNFAEETVKQQNWNGDFIKPTKQPTLVLGKPFNEINIRPPSGDLISLPEVIERSTGQPLLVNLQPSQVANVVIPHGSSTSALIFGGTIEPHKNGQYFDDPSPYPEPETSGFVGINSHKPNTIAQFASIGDVYPNAPNQKQVGGVINVGGQRITQGIDVNVPPLNFGPSNEKTHLHQIPTSNGIINVDSNHNNHDINVHVPPISFGIVNHGQNFNAHIINHGDLQHNVVPGSLNYVNHDNSFGEVIHLGVISPEQNRPTGFSSPPSLPSGFNGQLPTGFNGHQPPTGFNYNGQQEPNNFNNQQHFVNQAPSFNGPPVEFETVQVHPSSGDLNINVSPQPLGNINTNEHVLPNGIVLDGKLPNDITINGPPQRNRHPYNWNGHHVPKFPPKRVPPKHYQNHPIPAIPAEFMTPPPPGKNYNSIQNAYSKPVTIPLNFDVTPAPYANTDEFKTDEEDGFDDSKDDVNEDGEVIQESIARPLRPGQIPNEILKLNSTTTTTTTTENPVVVTQHTRYTPRPPSYYPKPNVRPPRPFKQQNIHSYHRNTTKLNHPHLEENTPGQKPYFPYTGTPFYRPFQKPKPEHQRPVFTIPINNYDSGYKPDPTIHIQEPVRTTFGNPLNNIFTQDHTPNKNYVPNRSTSMPVDPIDVASSTQRIITNQYENNLNIGSQTEEPFNTIYTKSSVEIKPVTQQTYFFGNKDVSQAYPITIHKDNLASNEVNIAHPVYTPTVTTVTTTENSDINKDKSEIFDSNESTNPHNHGSIPTYDSNENINVDISLEKLKPPSPPKERPSPVIPDIHMKPPKIEVNSPSLGIHRVPHIPQKPIDLDVQPNTKTPLIEPPTAEMKPPPMESTPIRNEEVMGLSPPPLVTVNEIVTTHKPIFSLDPEISTYRPIFTTSKTTKIIHPYVFETPPTERPETTTRKVSTSRRPAFSSKYPKSSTTTTIRPSSLRPRRPVYPWSTSTTTTERQEIIFTTPKATSKKISIRPTTVKPVVTPSMEIIIGHPNEEEHTTKKRVNLNKEYPDVVGAENSIRPTSVAKDSSTVTTTGPAETIFDNLYTKGEFESSKYNPPIHHAGNEIKVIDEMTKATPSLMDSKIMLPTKYITHTKTLTVTTTKTTVIKSLGAPPSTLTLQVTKTLTSTIVDTVTQTHTLVKPTSIVETVTTTISHTTASKYNNENNYASSRYPSFPVQATILHPAVNKDDDDSNLDEFIIKETDPPPTDSKEQGYVEEHDSIFVVMTDKKPGMVNIPKKEVLSGSAETIKIEDILDIHANRDEDLNHNEVNRVLLGGILIASPPSLDSPTIQTGLTNECRPDCKASRNELCQRVDGLMKCVCRPGFARMFPDRPCKPTYTYRIKIALSHLGKEKLKFEPSLADKSSTRYARLAQATHDGLDRMVMQSDLRDIYHGVRVNAFEPHKDTGVVNDFYVQLSDNTDETRLKDVFKKYLRHHNYSLGGTELYASKDYITDLNATDFDECTNQRFHDCSEHAQCFNLRGTYTCSCREGFADLSENPLYPGRICSAELIGCEKCHYHGTCYNRGDEQVLCECFQWYAGENCHINLKVLLIALVTLGAILLTLLMVCLIMTCCKRSRRGPKGSGIASGMSFLPHRAVLAPTMDKRAMIHDSSSEASEVPPYVPKKTKKLKGALKKPIHIDEVDHSHGQSLPYAGERDRSLTVMIPRAKYHPAPPVSPMLRTARTSSPSASAAQPFDKRKASIASSNETKLLSYLDAGPSPNKSDNNRRKYSNATSDMSKSGRKLSAGALVSAGFEVSATVGMGTHGNLTGTHGTCGTEADRSENATLVHKISADLLSVSNAGSQSQFTTLRKRNDDDPLDDWLDIAPRIMAVSEARSYDETTIQPPTKSIRSGPSSQHHNNDEANTMAERDLGSTFLLPHTHLYKPDRGSDISGFDSL